jgi:biopolymer transport protein ExbD
MNKKIVRMKTEPHVPFIALADIAWQIVILFLVASAFIVTNSISMNLPSLTTDQDKQKEEPVQLVAGADVLQVGEGESMRPVEYADLRETLRELLSKRKADDRAVIINCRMDLPWQRQVDVMTDVTKAGGMPVIASEDEGGK